MHPRYPAPFAEDLFSDKRKIQDWRALSDLYAQASIKELESSSAHVGLIEELSRATPPDVSAVRVRERHTGHEVVAFLSLYTRHMSDGLKRHFHRGLTSSDLVEYSHFKAMYLHGRHMANGIEDLLDTLNRWDTWDTYRAGRTHGQLAAVTSWSHQLSVQADSFRLIEGQLRDVCGMLLIKSPGPTGCSGLVQKRTDQILKWHPGAVMVPATQVIPRDRQVEWAALYLRLAGALENLALQVRLGSRSEIGEIREGAAAKRVGSSAMPHKKNPIGAEKVCGLARVARGYFAAIAEGGALWEDRDLTNSSMERVAVTDLAAVVEYMLVTMIDIMGHLEFHTNRYALHRIGAWSSLFQTVLQEVAILGPVEAGEVMRSLIADENQHVNVVKQDVHNWLLDKRGEYEAGLFLHRVDPILDDI